MKLITAFLPPDCLEAVSDSLDRNDARVVSATRVMDDRFSVATYRGAELRRPRPRLRVEVVVPNDLAVKDVIDAIARVVAEEPGDGLVLISNLDDVVRLPCTPRPADEAGVEGSRHGARARGGPEGTESSEPPEEP